MGNPKLVSTGIYKIYFTLLFFTVGVFIFGQKQVVTLSQCVDSVQAHSYLLNAEMLNTQSAQKDIDIRHTDYLPSISGSVGVGGNFLGANQYNFGQQWTMIHGDWSLGYLLRKTDRIAQQKLITATLKQEKVRMDGISRVTSLYMNVLQKRKQLELLDERASFLEKHRAVALSLWKAGVRTRLDVLQTETEVSVTKEEAVRVGMIIKNSMQELSRLTGMSDSISLEKIDAGNLIAGIDKNSLDRLLVVENPMYKIIQSEVQTQQLQISDIEAKQWPHVTVGGGYFVDGDPTADGNYWTVMTGVTIPIYQWRKIKTEKEQVQVRSDSKNMELHDLERELSIHVDKTLTRLDELEKMMVVSQERRETLKESLELANLNYKAGWVTNLEYLAVQQQLTNNLIKIEAIRLEYILNLIEFYLTTNQVDKIRMMEIVN